MGKIRETLSFLKPEIAEYHSKRLLHCSSLNTGWITCQCRHAEYWRISLIHVYTHMKDRNMCILKSVVQGNESYYCSSQKVSNTLIYKAFSNVLYSVLDGVFYDSNTYRPKYVRQLIQNYSVEILGLWKRKVYYVHFRHHSIYISISIRENTPLQN